MPYICSFRRVFSGRFVSLAELGFTLITSMLGLFCVLVALIALTWRIYGEEIARLYIPDEDEVQGEGADFLKKMPVHMFEQSEKKGGIFDSSRKSKKS